MAPSGVIDAPAWLTDALALDRWQKVLPGLLRRGAVDQDQLGAYCQVWARWRQAEEGLAKAGQLSVSASGRVVASPLLSIAKSAAGQVRALEKQLGIGEAEEPDPEKSSGDLLTRRELAERINIHMQTVTKWERDGMPIAERGRKGKPSRYREADARTWFAAREDAAKRSGNVDVAQERARKERAQGVLAEQTFQIRARILLPAEEVKKTWAGEVAGMRAVILSSYTTNADRVYSAAMLEGLPGVERALKELAYDVLRELANPDRDVPRAS